MQISTELVKRKTRSCCTLQVRVSQNARKSSRGWQQHLWADWHCQSFSHECYT